MDCDSRRLCAAPARRAFSAYPKTVGQVF